jgi:hypothetical protein
LLKQRIGEREEEEEAEAEKSISVWLRIPPTDPHQY